MIENKLGAGCSSVLHKTTKFFKRKEILQKGKRVCVYVNFQS